MGVVGMITNKNDMVEDRIIPVSEDNVMSTNSKLLEVSTN